MNMEKYEPSLEAWLCLTRSKSIAKYLLSILKANCLCLGQYFSFRILWKFKSSQQWPNIQQLSKLLYTECIVTGHRVRQRLIRNSLYSEKERRGNRKLLHNWMCVVLEAWTEGSGGTGKRESTSQGAGKESFTLSSILKLNVINEGHFKPGL